MPPYRALVTRSGEDRGKPYFLKNASRLQPGTGKGPQRHCQPKQLRNNPRGCFNAPRSNPSSPAKHPSSPPKTGSYHHRRLGEGRGPGKGHGNHPHTIVRGENRNPQPPSPAKERHPATFTKIQGVPVGSLPSHTTCNQRHDLTVDRANTATHPTVIHGLRRKDSHGTCETPSSIPPLRLDTAGVLVFIATTSIIQNFSRSRPD